MEMTSLQRNIWAPGLSRAREQLLEHQFLGELVRRMLLEGRTCEVLRAEFDASGHDVVLESEGILRHVQLKAMRADGRRAHVGVHTALAAKPSGCVVWMLVDPETLTVSEFLWLGGPPAQPLPDLGGTVVRHTKADSSGVKGVRPDFRQVRRSQFERVADYPGLIERLFGTDVQRDVLRLKRHLQGQPMIHPDAPAWLAHAQAGRFEAAPTAPSADDAGALAGLLNGWELSDVRDAQTAIEYVALVDRDILAGLPVLPSRLWAALFFEWRRLSLEGGFGMTDEEGRLVHWTSLLLTELGRS